MIYSGQNIYTIIYHDGVKCIIIEHTALDVGCHDFITNNSSFGKRSMNKLHENTHKEIMR